MDYEQCRYDDLNKIISVQEQLITFLKAEVERLKASQIVINPQPVQPPYPVYPGQPYTPNPLYPNQPWYIVTSDTKANIPPPKEILTGDPIGTVGMGTINTYTGPALPPGSVQSTAGMVPVSSNLLSNFQ